MTKEVHKVVRPGERIVRVLHPVGHEVHRSGLEIFRCRFQWVKELRFECFVAFVFFDEGFHEIEECHDRLATVLPELAPHQIERLNAVRAFVDHCDTRIADELLKTPFLGESRSAKGLLSKHCCLEAFVSQETLHHWN